MTEWSDTFVQFSRDMRHARLTRSMRYAVRGMVFVVPREFATDFASIPRFLWRVLPPWGDYGHAAILHDWLYRSGKVTRGEADKCLLEVMWRDGVAHWKMLVIYAGVRVGGWKAWNAHRKGEALESEQRLKALREKLAHAERDRIDAVDRVDDHAGRLPARFENRAGENVD